MCMPEADVFVTDRHGPAATNRAISADMSSGQSVRHCSVAAQNWPILACCCWAGNWRRLHGEIGSREPEFIRMIRQMLA